jgi:hypothetical protein
MFPSRAIHYVVPAAILLAAASVQAATAGVAAGRTEVFSGVLVDKNGAGSVPITLHVDEFTTAKRVGELSQVIDGRRQRAAVSALEHMKSRGWIRVGDVLGFEVPIIRSFTTSKGQRIVAVLDQPIEVFEQLRRTRSLLYPFGMVELNLDDNGNGNGALIAAARAMFTRDGKIEMVSYGTKPFRIIGVTEQTPKS